MDEVLQLERDVVKLRLRTAEEIHGVMIGIAAHEAEEITDPVGHTEAEHLLVEANGALDIRSEKRHVAKLERPDAGDLLVLAEITPVLEEIDAGALVIFERQHLTHARDRIVAQLAAHPVFFELARELAEIGIRRDLER